MKKMLPKKDNDVSQSNDWEKFEIKNSPSNKERLLAASTFHQGPLPSPESLFRYEQICPGAADRIIEMAEKEQNNIHQVRLLDSKSLHLGIVLGFISFILLIALTFAAIYYDKPWVATVLVAAVSICGLFINKNDNKRN